MQPQLLDENNTLNINLMQTNLLSAKNKVKKKPKLLSNNNKPNPAGAPTSPPSCLLATSGDRKKRLKLRSKMIETLSNRSRKLLPKPKVWSKLNRCPARTLDNLRSLHILSFRCHCSSFKSWIIRMERTMLSASWVSLSMIFSSKHYRTQTIARKS